MKFVIQRVLNAKCTIDNVEKSAIDKGFVVFIGITDDDTEEIAIKMIKKLCNMRIFEDENGKTNLSINQIDGKMMFISQFTLYANCKKGNRPSFVDAGSPDHANKMYEFCIKEASNYDIDVVTGEFGADMKISLVNDGPFTIVLDSKDIM